MVSDNDNIQILRRAYDRWSETRGRSIDDWVAITAPKFRLRSAADQHTESASFGAAPAGPDGMRSYLSGLIDHWIMERHDVDRFIADGDQVVAVIRALWRNRATNKRIACDVADVWTFEGGRATSLLELFDTAAMIEAATPDSAGTTPMGQTVL
jgi:ketosteroid isomerase-like protein